MRLPKEFTTCSTLLELIYRAERIATLQSLPAVIASAATRLPRRCARNDKFRNFLLAGASVQWEGKRPTGNRNARAPRRTRQLTPPFP